MKNQFKLQPVLNYRQILEDQAKQELARGLQQEAELLGRLTAEEREIEHLYQDFERRQQAGISCAEMLLFQNRISHKVEAVARMVESMERLQQQILRQRQGLTEASREKKLLEKLKEKNEQEFQQELKRREGIVLDEVAVQFHRR